LTQKIAISKIPPAVIAIAKLIMLIALSNSFTHSITLEEYRQYLSQKGKKDSNKKPCIKLNNFPYIAQTHPNSCGPAALAMLFQWYGINASESDILKEYPTTKDSGFRVDWLWECARKKGFSSKHGIGNIEFIKDFLINGAPVLVCQHSRKGGRMHYRIVIGYDDEKKVFIINDPASQVGKEYKMPYAEFEELWKQSWYKDGKKTKDHFYFVLKKPSKKPFQKR